MTARFYELYDSDDFDKAELLAALGRTKPSRSTLLRKYGKDAVLAYRETSKDELGNVHMSRPNKIGALG